MFWADELQNPDFEGDEKALRDRFVEEYLIDREPELAVLRLGFAKPFVKNFADGFMQEPYVQKQIKIKTAEQLQRLKTGDPLTDEAILILFIEAKNPANSSTSRVAAAGKLLDYAKLKNAGNDNANFPDIFIGVRPTKQRIPIGEVIQDD